MFVWDISCQPLGEECKLGSFFATIGRVVVKCTFLKKYILDIHSQQFGTILTVEDMYMLVLDISCQLLGTNVSWLVSVRPSGAGLEYVYFKK